MQIFSFSSALQFYIFMYIQIQECISDLFIKDHTKQIQYSLLDEPLNRMHEDDLRNLVFSSLLMESNEIKFSAFNH